MSVPPAVAGGSTIAITHDTRVDPPATAGGTDIDPSAILTIKQISSNPGLELVNAFGV